MTHIHETRGGDVLRIDGPDDRSLAVERGHDGGFGIRSWRTGSWRYDAPFVRIEGEDLEALREFLAPPAESYCFVDARGLGWVYDAEVDAWRSGDHGRSVDNWSFYWENKISFNFKGFDSWERVVKDYGIDSGEPQWHVGDLVVNDRAEYRRRTFAWECIWGNCAPRTFDDAEVSRRVRRGTLRAIRKGGVLQ